VGEEGDLNVEMKGTLIRKTCKKPPNTKDRIKAIKSKKQMA